MSNADFDKVNHLGGYLCTDCAKKFGWRMDPEHMATYFHGQCCVCREKKGLCSSDDYLIPNKKLLSRWD